MAKRYELATPTERKIIAVVRVLLGGVVGAVTFGLIWSMLAFPKTSVFGTLFIATTLTSAGLAAICGDAFFQRVSKLWEGLTRW